MPSDKDASFERVTGPISEDQAAEELLRRFLPPQDKDAEKPSASDGDNDEDKSKLPKDEADEDGAPAEKPEAEAEGDDQEDAQEDQDEDEAEEKDEAEHVVKITVEGDVHEVPVSKLTRLYGQEAALTKKSMEVAEARKEYNTKLEEQLEATKAVLTRAEERFKPYANLDFNLLATQLPAEEYTALRQAALTAYEDMVFLQQHTGEYVKKVQGEKAKTKAKAAADAVAVLSGPADKGGIEGWNEQLYNDIRAFAVSKGAPAEAVNEIVDPWQIKMMHSAMLYERGRTKGAVKTVKVHKGPKKIVKGTAAPAARTKAVDDGVKQRMDKFRSSGSVDDAAEVLLARMTAGRDQE